MWFQLNLRSFGKNGDWFSATPIDLPLLVSGRALQFLFVGGR
jgi:hypothetical protein